MPSDLQLDLRTAKELRRSQKLLHIRRGIGKTILFIVVYLGLLMATTMSAPLFTLVGVVMFLHLMKIIFFPSTPTVPKQVQLVNETMRAAKENGVKHLTLKVKREVGLALESTFHGVPIKTSLGASNDMLVEVTFP